MVKLLILMVLFSLSAFSLEQRVEEQRKYVFPDEVKIEKVPFDMGDFRFVPHTIYLAEDFYFDSPDKILAKNQLGLRLRRVRKGDSAPQYALQLKSEMEDVHAARIEEEDKDMKHQRFEGTYLIDVVERCVKDRKVSPEDSKFFMRWLASKKDSSLAPIQVFRRMKLPFHNLSPVVIGFSDRQRYHIIFDRKKQISPLLLLKDSGKNPLLIPPLVKENPSWIWIMEASWDESTFVPARGLKSDEAPFLIRELEIENKYRPREMGTALMNQLEAELKKQKKASSGKESKFFRAQEHFYGGSEK